MCATRTKLNTKDFFLTVALEPEENISHNCEVRSTSKDKIKFCLKEMNNYEM